MKLALDAQLLHQLSCKPDKRFSRRKYVMETDMVSTEGALFFIIYRIPKETRHGRTCFLTQAKKGPG
jgi:hypothetical protein